MSRDLTHCYVKIPVKPLDEATLNRVKDLENKLGCQLIAFSSSNAEYARLTEEQLGEIEALGKEIDASIVAYQSRPQRPSRPSACQY
jgi:hypothetical protein